MNEGIQLSVENTLHDLGVIGGEVQMKNYFNIPKELTTLNQWVNCGVDTEKPKIPYSPITLKRAKANIPSTWGSFEQAVDNVHTGKAQGIGFQFNANGIYGVDLDKVFVDGKLTPDAAWIVKKLNSYTERSLSGEGLHIIVKANGIHLQAHRRGFIEIYDRARYFIMTGEIYEH